MRAVRLTVSLISLATLLGFPSLASAKQTLAISSTTGFPAGGDPSYTTKLGLDTSAGTPSSLTIHLMPGVLASPAADPACLTSSTPDTSACQIGTGTVSVLDGLVSAPVVTAYLAPPPNSSDVVGINLVSAGLLTIHAGAQLVQTASGNVQTVLSVPLSSLKGLAGAISGMALTINGKLNGKPFNRMPTNCSPGHSTLTVAYANKTETTTASPDFKPTGCASLPYAPKFKVTAHEDAHNVGAAVATSVTQAIGQAATAKMILKLPESTLNANLKVVRLQNTSTPVGAAVASSPLLPKPLRGQVFLVGTPAHPQLKFRFPAPAALTLTGLVTLSNDTVTIPSVPDVPLTGLVVTFPGGPEALLAGACFAPTGLAQATLTGQNGKKAIAKHQVTLQGCPAHGA
jgi:hypothetical protein